MFEVKRVLDIQAELGESPAWRIEDQSLYWIDIHKKTLNCFDPRSGANRVWELPSMPGCFAFREGHGAVIPAQHGIYDLDFATGAIKHLMPAPFDPKTFRFNDGRTDRQGRLWVGSMPLDLSNLAPARAAMYRYDGGTLVQGIAPITVGNGTAFSPDGRTLYRSDAVQRCIYAYDYDPQTGEASKERVFATLAPRGEMGVPDGATVDTQGGYWIALPLGKRSGEIARFTVEGKLDIHFETPVLAPTMVAFGGPNLSTLYITSARLPHLPHTHTEGAGSVFAVETNFQGIPETPFKARGS